MRTVAFSGSQLVNEYGLETFIFSFHIGRSVSSVSGFFLFQKNCASIILGDKNQLEHLSKSSPRVDFYSKVFDFTCQKVKLWMFVKDRLIEIFKDTTVDFEILPENDVFQIRMFCYFE